MSQLSPRAIDSTMDVGTLHTLLRKHGCSGCELGDQKDFIGPVICRGNTSSPWMIIGEAPGKNEDRKGVPFCGPAGELLDKIISFMDLPEILQPCISNAVMCRPIAKKGSGKENNKPTVSIYKACRPYLLHVIDKVKPRVIVLTGSTAVGSVLPDLKYKKLGDIVGKLHTSPEFPGIIFTVMYHPAFLLRKRNMDKKQYKPFQKATIECVNMVKEILLETNNED
jgi:DNA polymerase